MRREWKKKELKQYKAEENDDEKQPYKKKERREEERWRRIWRYWFKRHEKDKWKGRNEHKGIVETVEGKGGEEGGQKNKTNRAEEKKDNNEWKDMEWKGKKK